MLPTTTRKATHVFGAPRNWKPDIMGPCGSLSVRKQEGAGGVVEFVSTWKPTLEEINALVEGGSVILTVCGRQPVVSLGVELLGEDMQAVEAHPLTAEDEAALK